MTRRDRLLQTGTERVQSREGKCAVFLAKIKRLVEVQKPFFGVQKSSKIFRQNSLTNCSTNGTDRQSGFALTLTDTAVSSPRLTTVLVPCPTNVDFFGAGVKSRHV